jgi:hypothetical protein
MESGGLADLYEDNINMNLKGARCVRELRSGGAEQEPAVSSCELCNERSGSIRTPHRTIPYRTGTIALQLSTETEI